MKCFIFKPVENTVNLPFLSISLKTGCACLSCIGTCERDSHDVLGWQEPARFLPLKSRMKSHQGRSAGAGRSLGLVAASRGGLELISVAPCLWLRLCNSDLLFLLPVIMTLVSWRPESFKQHRLLTDSSHCCEDGKEPWAVGD